MKQFLAAIVLVVTSIASLDAATLTFQRPFYLSDEYEFDGVPTEPGTLDARYFDIVFGWEVPGFDPALGSVEALFLDLNGVFSITGQLTPDTPAHAVTWFLDPLTGGLGFYNGTYLPCVAPCIERLLVQDEWAFAYLPSASPFLFPIGRLLLLRFSR